MTPKKLATFALAFGALAFFVVAGAMTMVSIALASSHSEAPGTAKDRLADDTDLYAYVSKDAPDKVTFVGLWIPLLEPNGGPNFYSFDDEAHYYFNIDNVGDCRDHIRYEFTFTTTRRNGNTFLYNTGAVTSLDDPDLNVRQTYTVTRVDDGQDTELATGLPVAPNYVGPVSMPDYNSLAQAAVQTLSDGTKIFVGPRDDPFFVDLAAIFDLLTIRKLPGNKGGGVDGVGGYDVMAVVMQVPMTRLTRDGNPPDATNSILGIYSSSERLQNRVLNGDGTVTVSGPEVQVSRLGMPLVNEVVIALQDKDKFNASKPVDDGQFLSYVTNPELPVLLNLLYGIHVPATPRNDLVSVFLTGVDGLNKPAGGSACEMLRLNMAIAPARRASRFGVLQGDFAGFPNGRRLADDVVDIELRVAAGVLVPGFDIKPNRQLGDGVNDNDVPFLPYFPYVAPPHNPLNHVHHKDQHRSDNEMAIRVDEDGGAGDVDDDESTTPGAGLDMGAKPAQSGLSIAGSNPGSSSRLRFAIATAGHVRLDLYDVKGRRVRTLVDQDAAPGRFETGWDGRDDAGTRVGQGVYFARLTLDGQLTQSKKLVLVQP